MTAMTLHVKYHRYLEAFILLVLIGYSPIVRADVVQQAHQNYRHLQLYS